MNNENGLVRLIEAALVEAAPIAIVVVDDSGNIAFVNARAERLFGYAQAQLLGESVERLLPEAQRAAHPALRAEYLATPVPRPMGASRVLFAQHRDGSRIPVEIGLSPLSTARGTFILAAVIEVAKRT
jgi:PAS domain S-box-containing protein